MSLCPPDSFFGSFFGLSGVSSRGLWDLHCSVWFSGCIVRAPGCSWALPCRMWDLSFWTELNSCPPALESRFLTTGPQWSLATSRPTSYSSLSLTPRFLPTLADVLLPPCLWEGDDAIFHCMDSGRHSGPKTSQAGHCLLPVCLSSGEQHISA